MKKKSIKKRLIKYLKKHKVGAIVSAIMIAVLGSMIFAFFSPIFDKVNILKIVEKNDLVNFPVDYGFNGAGVYSCITSNIDGNESKSYVLYSDCYNRFVFEIYNDDKNDIIVNEVKVEVLDIQYPSIIENIEANAKGGYEEYMVYYCDLLDKIGEYKAVLIGDGNDVHTPGIGPIKNAKFDFKNNIESYKSNGYVNIQTHTTERFWVCFTAETPATYKTRIKLICSFEGKEFSIESEDIEFTTINSKDVPENINNKLGIIK